MDFEAPKTFAEYFELFPDFHRKWLAKHHFSLMNKPEDFDDAAQYLLLETLRKDRVPKYDMMRRRKAGEQDSARLFLHWMGSCFANDMTTMYKAKHSGKRRVNEGAFSLNEVGQASSGGHHSDKHDLDEGLSYLSQPYRLRTERSGDLVIVGAQIAEFHRFVAKYRPELVPSLDNIDAASSDHRTTLGILAQQMTAGRTPQGKRKPYTRRKPYKPRKAKFSAERIGELAAQGLRAKDAAAILGCSDTYIGYLVLRLFKTNWKGLVRLRQQQKSEKSVLGHSARSND